MTAQNGSLVLIKVGNGASPEGFSTIGGLRICDMKLDNHVLDATNLESGAWRQLFSTAVSHAMTIQGSGLFTNSVSEETLRGYAFSGTANNYRFIFANGNYVSGPFMVISYERSGQYDSEETYSITLESAGAISFAIS